MPSLTDTIHFLEGLRAQQGEDAELIFFSDKFGWVGLEQYPRKIEQVAGKPTIFVQLDRQPERHS